MHALTAGITGKRNGKAHMEWLEMDKKEYDLEELHLQEVK